MNRPAFVELIESAIGDIQLWVDTVPEEEEIPALTYTHITDGGTRLLNGKMTGTWDTWRVRVVGKNRADSDDVIAMLKALDNTSNDNFQRVTIRSIQAVPSQPEDIYVSSLLDFKTFD